MINKQPRGSMGIFVSENSGTVPFSESEFCRKLCLIGRKRGISVYVFTPSSVNPNRSSVLGYSFDNGGWQQKLYAPPDIVYDRCFAYERKMIQRKHIALNRLSELYRFIYLTRGLSGKWTVYQALKRYPELVPHLPETVLYSSEAQLAQWLDAHQGEAFLKPQHGTHGKRTLHVESPAFASKLRLTGRDGDNQVLRRQFLSRDEGLGFIDTFIGERSFILQPYLELVTSHGNPFDIRALMQKNDRGSWELTGLAARIGAKESITSNLHGGGTPCQAEPFLQAEFGPAKGNSIAAKIRELALTIPVCLESQFGRLAELGIDFGVDRAGNVWVIETNSKPGRSSFFRIGDTVSARKSIENPILYARYLLLSKP